MSVLDRREILANIWLGIVGNSALRKKSVQVGPILLLYVGPDGPICLDFQVSKFTFLFSDCVLRLWHAQDHQASSKNSETGMATYSFSSDSLSLDSRIAFLCLARGVIHLSESCIWTI